MFSNKSLGKNVHYFLDFKKMWNDLKLFTTYFEILGIAAPPPFFSFFCYLVVRILALRCSMSSETWSLDTIQQHPPTLYDFLKLLFGGDDFSEMCEFPVCLDQFWYI